LVFFFLDLVRSEAGDATAGGVEDMAAGGEGGGRGFGD
jgi:hypothetical protein